MAIVIIQPILSSWWQPSNRILKYLWNIFTVTIAAQFGIIPIGIYYFHQFPGLFFISNLVIIPFLGFILGFGILIIVLSIFDLLPSYVADLYENVIRGMNTFISWISSKGDFLFQDISFNIFYVTISYALIGCFIWYYKLKSYKSIITALIAVGALQSYSIIIKTNGSQNKFIIFHKSSYTIIGEQHGIEITLYHNLKDISSEKIVTNYKVGENIKIIENDSIISLYRFEDKTLFIVDSLGVINIETIKPQIVLLRNSPKINLNRLIQKLKPQLIISDGSNFRSYQERWQQTCDEMNIPIHRTSERGAFVYPY